MGAIKVKKILDDLYKKYCVKYGAAIFDLAVNDTKDGVEIKGKVLIENQRNDIINAVGEAGIKVARHEIKIVSDPKEKLEAGWGEINDNIVDVLGRYVAKENLTPRAINKFRATQLEKGDTVRILFEKDGQALIQSEDLTLGWVDKLKIKNEKLKSLSQNDIQDAEHWTNFIRAEKDRTVNIKKIEKEKIEEFVKRLSGKPYVLGGTTEKGIDCSALVQKMYKELYGILLPRHSEDQAKCGILIKNIEESKVMDLIFLKVKKNGHFHIGIVIDISKNILIFNARLNNGGVVVQDLEEMLKDYDLLSVRRVIV